MRGSSSLPPAPALSKQSKLHTRTTEGRPNQAARHKKSNQQSVDTPTTITFPPHTQKHQRWAVPLSMGTVFFFFFFFGFHPPIQPTNQPIQTNKQIRVLLTHHVIHSSFSVTRGKGVHFQSPTAPTKLTHSRTPTHTHSLAQSFDTCIPLTHISSHTHTRARILLVTNGFGVVRPVGSGIAHQQQVQPPLLPLCN